MSKKANLQESEPLLSGLLKVRYVVTSANFSQDVATNFEHPFGSSETVPGMTIDLRLMLQRQAAGVPIPTHHGVYSDNDYPDFWKMDEFELSQYRLELAENMKRMSDELHLASKELERKQDEERNKSNNDVTQKTENPQNGSKKQESDDSKP